MKSSCKLIPRNKEVKIFITQTGNKHIIASGLFIETLCGNPLRKRGADDSYEWLPFCVANCLECIARAHRRYNRLGDV